MPDVSGAAEIERTFHRRRVLLAALAGAALFTLAVAFVARQGQLWGVHAVADALLLGYLAALVHLRNVAAEQEMARSGLGR